MVFKAGLGSNPTAGSIYSLIPKIAIAFHCKIIHITLLTSEILYGNVILELIKFGIPETKGGRYA